jgi:hypothetical protein
MYGMGATYDSIEGRFRIIRKEAEQLRQEVDSGARPQAPVRGATANGGSAPTTPASTPKKPRAVPGTPASGTGRKKNGAVFGSRVEKTPTKKSKNQATNPLSIDIDDVVVIKEEPDATSSTSATSSMVQTPSFSEQDNMPHVGGNSFSHHRNDDPTPWHSTSLDNIAGDLGTSSMSYTPMSSYAENMHHSFGPGIGGYMSTELYGNQLGFGYEDEMAKNDDVGI